MKPYLWHGQPVTMLARAPFLKDVKRNALVEFEDGSKMVVPWRALRKVER